MTQVDDESKSRNALQTEFMTKYKDLFTNYESKTCVCGASKEMAREKSRLKRAVSELAIRLEHVLRKEQEVSTKDQELKAIALSQSRNEKELKEKSRELNEKIEKLNTHNMHLAESKSKLEQRKKAT